jgi:hypothetical protein
MDQDQSANVEAIVVYPQLSRIRKATPIGPYLHQAQTPSLRRYAWNSQIMHLSCI